MKERESTTEYDDLADQLLTIIDDYDEYSSSRLVDSSKKTLPRWARLTPFKFCSRRARRSALFHRVLIARRRIKWRRRKADLNNLLKSLSEEIAYAETDDLPYVKFIYSNKMDKDKERNERDKERYEKEMQRKETYLSQIPPASSSAEEQEDPMEEVEEASQQVTGDVMGKLDMLSLLEEDIEETAEEGGMIGSSEVENFVKEVVEGEASEDGDLLELMSIQPEEPMSEPSEDLASEPLEEVVEGEASEDGALLELMSIQPEEPMSEPSEDLTSEPLEELTSEPSGSTLQNIIDLAPLLMESSEDADLLELNKEQSEELISEASDEFTSDQLTSKVSEELSSEQSEELTSEQSEELTSEQSEELTSEPSEELTSIQSEEITSEPSEELTSIQSEEPISAQSGAALQNMYFASLSGPKTPIPPSTEPPIIDAELLYQEEYEAALDLVKRYIKDRDRLDYYYYDQDTLEYDLKKEKKGFDRIISGLLDLFSSTKTDDKPLLPSELVAKYFCSDATYDDTMFYNAAVGADAIVRQLGLFGSRRSLYGKVKVDSGVDKMVESKDAVKMVLDDVAVKEMDSDDKSVTAQVFSSYHYEYTDGSIVPDSRGVTLYGLSRTASSLRIKSVFDVMEPFSPKPADFGLKLLSLATNTIEFTKLLMESSSKDEDISEVEKDILQIENDDTTKEEDKGITAVSSYNRIPQTDGEKETVAEKYYKAWNKRDMLLAASCFTDDVEYVDTQYPSTKEGKDAVEAFLSSVSEILPSTFQFVVDNIVSDEERDTIGVKWHVENNDGGKREELPFTRGASMYCVDDSTSSGDLIEYAIDVPEAAVFKPGVPRYIYNIIQTEQVRLVPLVVWALYVYIVFFSDGIIPGENALQLEGRTWEEVKDLSLNFFLVSPTLNLPFSPIVHPMLEGVFNLLLSWAALFSGFLSDERRDKPNVLDFGYIVVGMQFLTSAFYLPYLATRTSESPRLLQRDVVDDDTNERDFLTGGAKEDIKGELQSNVAENKKFHGFLGIVGTYSIFWGLYARYDIYSDFDYRLDSFMDLLSIDRVGCSFLVDLAIFAAFQGWLVDDDLRRRGVEPELAGPIRTVAKYVPFFGLVYYLLFRPCLPSLPPSDIEEVKLLPSLPKSIEE